MMRIRVGAAVIVGVLVAAAPPPAGASSGGAVPLAGNWEGTGPHGLPLSFRLARHGGHLVATSLAVGYPASCPAIPRDAEAVPLGAPVYAGPGGGQANGPSPLSPPAFLSGRVPQSTQTVYLRGRFSSPRTGAFTVQIHRTTGCAWPARTLAWTVHRAARRRVGDGTWTGPLTAAGVINGNVRLVVGEEGRVVNSFASFFTCVTDTQQGNTNFRALPAFEFVRPDGSFYSPLDGGRVRGRGTTWSGRFSAAGRLTGTLRIFDDCTNRLITARFSAMRR